MNGCMTTMTSITSLPATPRNLDESGKGAGMPLQTDSGPCFDWILSFFSHLGSFSAPAQKDGSGIEPSEDDGKVESSHCPDDSSVADAKSTPSHQDDMSFLAFLQDMQPLAGSFPGYTDISEQISSPSLSVEEAYEQNPLKNQDRNLQSAATGILHVRSGNPSVDDLIKKMEPGDKDSASKSVTTAEIRTAPSSEEGMTTDHSPPLSLNPRETSTRPFPVTKPDVGSDPLKAEKEGCGGEVPRSAVDQTHLLKDLITAAGEGSEPIGCGTAGRPSTGGVHEEKGEETRTPSLVEVRDLSSDGLSAARATAAEPVQKDATHDVPSVVQRGTREVGDIIHQKGPIVEERKAITVSVEPEGIGKLDIHLNFDKGTLHTQINVSQNMVRDLLREQSGQIMATLLQEGLNVGSFSVSLRGGGAGWNQQQQGPVFAGPSEEKEDNPVHGSGHGLVSIFI
jgi:Flagellar hook-length control protein FliK